MKKESIVMPNPKRQKLDNNADQQVILDYNLDVYEADCISCLEDALLCHILSFLSTKQVVRTSALSKRWKNVWTKTPVLDFSEKCRNLSRFVSRVLLLNNHPHLKKLCFNNLLNFSLQKVHAWISNLILRDIHEIHLYNERKDRKLYLPLMNFTRVNLVILKIFGGIVSKLPTLVKFPTLKVLHLTDLRNVKNNLNRLVAGCPILEELSIYNCRWSCVDIKSSTLKSLTVCYLDEYFISKLLVRAPNLEQFSLSCLIFRSWYFSTIRCLRWGRISHCVVPLKLFRVLSYVQSLCLSSSPWIEDSVIKAIAGGRLVFRNLTNLELEVNEDALAIMPEILKCSPNLVSFVFIKGVTMYHREPTSIHPEGKWVNSLFMLDCFSSLESIEISYVL